MNSKYDVNDIGSCQIYREWEWGQTYNIGTGINYSINEIAKFIGGKIINIPPRQGESRITLANANKAREHFGWIPKVKLEDWLLKNK
ncbi:hypothetical protein EBU94_06255 [bacterium]|nr:hypothetical protein [bacterium]